MHTPILKMTLGLTVGMLLGATAHAEAQVQLSAGAFFSTGDFDAADSTDVTVAPFSVRLSQGPWSVRATVPYVSLRGPANVTVVVDDASGGGAGSNSGSDASGSRRSGRGSGSNSGPGPGSSGDDSDPIAPPGSQTSLQPDAVSNLNRTDSGIGDASISATYSLDQLGSAAAYLDLTGRVRLPTGDETRGLGVGATDYALIAELGWENGTGGSYISAGRRFLGNVAGLNRRDGWQLGFGASLNATDTTVLGAFYERRDASVRGGADLGEAGIYITKAVTRSLKIELSGSAGLSKTSTNYEVGLTVIWKALDRTRE